MMIMATYGLVVAAAASTIAYPRPFIIGWNLLVDGGVGVIRMLDAMLAWAGIA